MIQDDSFSPRPMQRPSHHLRNVLVSKPVIQTNLIIAREVDSQHVHWFSNGVGVGQGKRIKFPRDFQAFFAFSV